MKKELRDRIIGSIVLFVFIGIPLGFILSPVATLAFAVVALWGIARESKKPAVVNKAKVRANNAKLSKDDEELITTILPAINDRNK